MSTKQFMETFEGRIGVSPTDRKTPQIVLSASPEVAEHLDRILLNYGIIALKEPDSTGDKTILRIDYKNK